MQNTEKTQPVTLLANCSGLNNILDPFQPVDDSSLAYASNVVITDSHKIQQCPGTELVVSLTTGHSLFCDGGACLLAQGTSLYELHTDDSLHVLKTGMSGGQIDFAQVGNAIYFTDKIEVGVYDTGVIYPWVLDTYIMGDTTKYFEEEIPIFEHIEKHHGYMLGSLDNCLYSSELARFGLWNMKEPIMLPTRITMIKHVDTGVFVSDLKNIYFFSGQNTRNFKVGDPVTTFPACEYGDAFDYVDGLSLSQLTPGLCAVFNTAKGLCIGTPDGRVFSVANERVDPPSVCTHGATVLIDSNVLYTAW